MSENQSTNNIPESNGGVDHPAFNGNTEELPSK